MAIVCRYLSVVGPLEVLLDSRKILESIQLPPGDTTGGEESSSVARFIFASSRTDGSLVPQLLPAFVRNCYYFHNIRRENLVLCPL